MAALAAVAVPPTASRAEPLPELLAGLLESHNLVAAAEADLSAARERVEVALGEWYPQLSVTGSYGHERYDKPTGTRDTSMAARQLDISIRQLLWDFDLTASTVRASRLSRQQAEAALETARQDILLRGIIAYLDVLNAQEVLDFAERSEDNIRRQVDLENTRVSRGAGLSTDVLQAQTQLAGAEARRVQAQGILQVSRNTFRAVFYKVPENLTQAERPSLRTGMLPATLDEAIETALAQNPQLQAAYYSAEAQREKIVSAKADGYYPRIDAVGEMNFQEDEGGTVGSQNEQVAKIQMRWPFNLGLTARNSVNAARSDFVAAQKRYADARGQIEELARNAWQNLATARQRAALLRKQAEMSERFLELARKERRLGRRSLLDVLDAETTLVNARSDASTAETDELVAAFSLLNVLGALDTELTMAN